MTEVINLNRARKKQKTEAKEKKAQENRVKFGRTKRQRTHAEQDKKKAQNIIDAHEIQPTDDSAE